MLFGAFFSLSRWRLTMQNLQVLRTKIEIFFMTWVSLRSLIQHDESAGWCPLNPHKHTPGKFDAVSNTDVGRKPTTYATPPAQR